MPRKLLQFLLVLGFASLFNILFWQEKAALNLVLFGILLGVAVLRLNRSAIGRTNVRLTAAGTLLAGLFVLLHASEAARAAFVLSYVSFLGFVYAPALRSLPASLAISTGNFFAGPFWMADSLRKIRVERLRRFKLGYYLGIGFIPVLIVGLFFVIFSAANPKFGGLFADIGLYLGDFLDTIFTAVSPVRIMFFLFGLYLLAGIFFFRPFSSLANRDAHAKQTLLRIRKPRMFRSQIPQPRVHRGEGLPPIPQGYAHPYNPPLVRKGLKTGLRREYRIALLAFGLVNLLALLNNALDISWIWFGFEAEPGFSLKQFVHEGTYLLILSILIAMGIMFYFFRGNLNFISENKWLRYAAYFWIVQNAIMVVSVGIRNYHYISHFGLAYKRIGVYFFLALVLFGLITLFLKIRNKKTFYHVVRVNAWAVYAVLLLLATVNWDGFITRYNISHVPVERMDTEFLLHMSDKTLPLLHEHKDELFTDPDKVIRAGGYRGYFTEEEYLEERIREATERYQSHSWLSWNFADAAAMSYFKKHTPDLIQ